MSTINAVDTVATTYSCLVIAECIDNVTVLVRELMTELLLDDGLRQSVSSPLTTSTTKNPNGNASL